MNEEYILKLPSDWISLDNEAEESVWFGQECYFSSGMSTMRVFSTNRGVAILRKDEPSGMGDDPASLDGYEGHIVDTKAYLEENPRCCRAIREIFRELDLYFGDFECRELENK